MVLFGSPDRQTIKELGQLDSLQTISIVDDESDYLTDQKIKAVQEKLPGKEVKIISPTNYEPV